MTFNDYTDKWKNEVLSLKKPSTIASFRSHLSRLTAAFGNRTLSEITNAAVQTYLSGVSKELSPKSVKNLWATFRLVLDNARRDGLIDKLPEPVLPKVMRTKQPCFTVEQMQTLASNSVPSLYYVLAETGLRIGEALALVESDVNLKDKTITVNKTMFGNQTQPSPKTDASNRIICVSEQFCQIWSSKSFSFYCKPLGELLRYLHEDMQKAGIAQNGATGFHAFRRGNASLCAQIGVPHHIIAMRLGHRGTDITSRYVSLPELADREWAEQIGAVLSGMPVRKVNAPVAYEQTTVKDEAVSALVNLGYRQKDARKVVMQMPAYTFDDIIRKSLPMLRVR